METKKYYAENMPAAMEQIKRELGVDAIIIRSRKIKKKFDPFGLHKSLYEVVVSCEPEEPFLGRKATAEEPAAPFLKWIPSAADPTPKYEPTKKEAKAPAQQYTTPVQPERFAQLIHKSGTSSPKQEEEDMLKILSAGQVTEQSVAVTPAAKMRAYAAFDAQPDFEEAPVISSFSTSVLTSPCSAPAGNFMPFSNGEKVPNPPVKRGRGRPRKNPLPNVAPVTRTAGPVPAVSFREETQTLARLDALERMIQEISRKLSDQPSRQAQKNPVVFQGRSGQELNLDALLGRLEEQGVDRTALEALATEAAERLQEGIGDYQALCGALEQMLGKPRYIRPSKKKPRSIMFVGSTGVGKTTTLVKLVSSCIFERGAKAGIINADVFRVGAQDQLNAYARILNVPVTTIYDSRELTEAIAAYSALDFVFIDTSGKAPQDETYQAELSRLISLGDIQEIYLTVSSTTSSRACRCIAKEYQNIGPYRVVVSKLDESGSYGAAVNLCHASGQPLSYITTGQNVPEDIQRAKVDEIITSLLR